jgi:hypothetical protein
MRKLFSVILAVLSITILLAGCSSSTTPSTSTTVSVQTYAGPLTENSLTSLGKNDYTAFSADFDTSLKNILTQAVYDQLVSQVKANLGQYQAKVFVSSATEGSTTTVLYIAKYSGEPAGVTITMSFQTENGTTYVHGFNMDSPNLRGQPIDVAALRSYTDPVTANILGSLNNNDYTGFLKDMDSTMKAAESQKAFDQIYNLLKSHVGNYVSLEFESAANQQQYIVVRYLAKYSTEPDGVWITISFDKDRQVAGLYFDSPKMRAK